MLPNWLNKKFDINSTQEIQSILRKLNLNTVCEEAFCPNISECFANKTATFLILGKYCTRNCRFCNVSHNKPEVVNIEEPDMIVKAVEYLNLKYVVITSVTRDDLKDYGAAHFANVVKRLKLLSNVKIELLIPDFMGDINSLKLVVESSPEVVGHNIETVKRLYPSVRPQANYEKSLFVLRTLKGLKNNLITKSGIMLGLGESKDEVESAMKDIRLTGCDILTIGQYLRPSKEHLPVTEYIKPEVFEYYKILGNKMGFKHVESSPFVRSSYNAQSIFLSLS